MNFFPDNARESKEISETNYGIVSVPLTTFTSESKFSLINKVFYPSVEQNILIKKR